ncbi:M56 family metallopeptidase [Diplocloster agilis]|nr:M56 family metallopeptidase [Diplocloster agilis]
MEKLFLTILNMSITASYVILIILAVRMLLKRAPKIFSYILWCAVLFRLVCPLSIEGMFSLLPSGNAAIPEVTVYQEPAMPENPNPNTADNSGQALQTPVRPADKTLPQLGMMAAAVIWLSGIIGMLAYSIRSLGKMRKLRRTACLYKKDEIQGILTRRKINIYEGKHVQTPFVMGILRPAIYIPIGLEESERSYIICHEQVHIKRFDYLIKPLAYLILCIHWFNPLVWVSFLLMEKDMELSCDERVLHDMGNQIRKEYASSLLALASGRRALNGGPLAFGENDIKSRIRNVLNYHRPAFWGILGSAVVLIIVSAGLICSPAARESMKWAKNLSSEDITKIELVVMPADEEKQYRVFAPEEYPEIVKLMKDSRGRYVREPEELAGGELSFYITTTDGVRHRYANSGNVYLVIDEDSYRASYGWLSRWDYEGDDKLPEGFFDGAQDNGEEMTGGADTGGITFPYSMGITPVTLADKSSVDVELVMTDGKLWRSDDPDFMYGGYFQDGENYVGKFELRTLKDGRVLDQMPVQLSQPELCFYGPVTLVTADYNGDKNPEFTLGSWVWSGGNEYNLYSIDTGGRLSLLSYIERHDEREASVLLDQPAPGSFAVNWYNQQSGEDEAVLYHWNGKNFEQEE